MYLQIYDYGLVDQRKNWSIDCSEPKIQNMSGLWGILYSPSLHHDPVTIYKASEVIWIFGTEWTNRRTKEFQEVLADQKKVG